MPRSPNGVRKEQTTISLSPLHKLLLRRISEADGVIETTAECAARVVAEQTAVMMGGGEGFVDILLGRRVPTPEFEQRLEEQRRNAAAISQFLKGLSR